TAAGAAPRSRWSLPSSRAPRGCGRLAARFRIGPMRSLPPMLQRTMLFRRSSEPAAINIVFDREVYLVRVRRHRQARRYTLRIHSATREVLLTMPPRGSLKQAREFAEKHGAWIAARLERLPQPVPFTYGATLPLRGV